MRKKIKIIKVSIFNSDFKTLQSALLQVNQWTIQFLDQ